MTKKKESFNYFPVTNEPKAKWEAICPPGEFRIVSGSMMQSSFSSILSKDLLIKFDSVFIAGSATADGIVYFLANGNRIHPKDNAIDQMPFGLMFIGDSTSGSGCLIQHGNWPGRTIPIPGDFWNHISASGISNYYSLSEIPTSASGKLSDLKIDSQYTAFGKIIDGLHNQYWINKDEAK